MPNQPKTQHRSIRVPDDLWRASQARAAGQGETVTAVVLRALDAYTAQPRVVILSQAWLDEARKWAAAHSNESWHLRLACDRMLQLIDAYEQGQTDGD